MLTPKEIEAKIIEIEESRLKVMQQVCAHDGYLQALREVLNPKRELKVHKGGG